MNNLHYEIDTKVVGNGDIVQQLAMVHDNVREEISRLVLATGDQQVRDALIKLGWTPPREVVK